MFPFLSVPAAGTEAQITYNKRNNTTKQLNSRRTLLFGWFFLWQRYLQKVPVCFVVPLDLKAISDETLSKV